MCRNVACGYAAAAAPTTKLSSGVCSTGRRSRTSARRRTRSSVERSSEAASDGGRVAQRSIDAFTGRTSPRSTNPGGGPPPPARNLVPDRRGPRRREVAVAGEEEHRDRWQTPRTRLRRLVRRRPPKAGLDDPVGGGNVPGERPEGVSGNPRDRTPQRRKPPRCGDGRSAPRHRRVRAPTARGAPPAERPGRGGRGGY